MTKKGWKEGEIVVHNIPYTVFNVKGDGNCMFHSVCQHPYFAKQGYGQQRLRTELANKVQDLYQEHKCVRKAVHGNKSLIYDGTIADVIRRMRTSTIWCGQYECTFIALIFPIRISIVMPDVEPGTYKIAFISEEALKRLRIDHLKNNDEELHDVTLMFYEGTKFWGEGMQPLSCPNHFTWLRNDSNMDVHAANAVETLQKFKLNQQNPIEIDQEDVVGHIPAKDTALPRNMKSDNSDGDKPIQPMPKLTSKKVTTKKVTLNAGQWYELTHFFHNNMKNKYKSQKAFLESNESNPLTANDKSSFSRNYREYKDGTLSSKINPDSKRNRQSPFSEIETELHQYLMTEKLELTHKQVQHKAREIWKKNNIHCKVHFNASKGWLHRMLKRWQIKLCRKRIDRNDND